jgi:hypothetical protein
MSSNRARDREAQDRQNVMMDKELPAKIWVPILAACALIPFIAFSGDTRFAIPRTVGLVTLGLTVYLAVYLFKRVKSDRNFKDRFLTVAYAFGAFIILMVGVAIMDETKPPPTPEEFAAQEQQKQVEARRDYLFKKDHLSDSECKELYGADSDMCKPIMSADAWRQFQADAAQSHDAAEAARAYSDALHDYVDTYHRLPPEHVVIDPN